MEGKMHKKIVKTCAERQWTGKVRPWYNKGTTKGGAKKMKVERMQYRRYKAHYADCKTVSGSYDKAAKSIEVIIPEGRMKPSGTRNQTYQYLTFHGTRRDGTAASITIKATCLSNAVKRLPRDIEWDI